ncbi:hypothetical protein MPNT_70018 [Candidatus Methylacidithermus pantelleriae]|uniref:Uncharacterized protein n=1 Tax=Candidatus Methylacidithermus pantelleriae TaxID=2744239 RepID=A0A8J2BLX4_9BACT|nr:hypothetical protein MPNT_70018 [Candidatus Methylacidithermus pantelleriae]
MRVRLASDEESSPLPKAGLCVGTREVYEQERLGSFFFGRQTWWGLWSLSISAQSDRGGNEEPSPFSLLCATLVWQLIPWVFGRMRRRAKKPGPSLGHLRGP